MEKQEGTMGGSVREKQEGIIASVAVSAAKGEKKTPVPEAVLESGLGIRGDAHAAGGLRQVSLLMEESIERMCGQGVQVTHGDFAENLVTRGVDLGRINLGDLIRIGDQVELSVSKIGKECPAPCAIYHQVGYCIMPTEGIFCRVVRPGTVRPGDRVVVEPGR
jgi:MOSC domain-containing protein YiiM